jgi:hypothetical protein
MEMPAIGKILNNFSVEEYFEVFEVNENGIKIRSIGFFKNEDAAKVIKDQCKKDPDMAHFETFKVEKCFVLTSDEKTGFIVLPDMIFLTPEKETLKKIKENAFDKLLPSERKILGLG